MTSPETFIRRSSRRPEFLNGVTRRRFERSGSRELHLSGERELAGEAGGREWNVAPDSRRARRIVLTGGPGGGKSTIAASLARELPDDLWILPESATLLYGGGLPRGDDAAGVRVAQRAIFDVQRALERAHSLQHPGRTQVCDRATLDGAAYWPDGSEAFFAAMGTTHERELARYDAAVFLHTAASLPAGYEQRPERTEAVEEALALDAKVFELYRSHPRLIVVPSTGSFLEKMVVVSQAVAEVLAEPVATASPREAAYLRS